MYNSRLRPELLDSLDYLIPPVKKLPRAVYKDLSFNDVKLINQSLLTNCHRAVFENPFLSKTSESDVQTCSSLILKKTTKQLIHEQYSILNLSTCNRRPDLCLRNKTRQGNLYVKEEKPIIKVTVIPKAKETQTSKVFNKRPKYSKTVQSTISNQDSSIHNQNDYLLIKGKKREKVHDLRLSESANFSKRSTNHKYGDISIDRMTESRQIIKSLNMDKKKRNNKNKKAIRTHVSDKSPKDRYCDKFLNPNDRKSRVTVVGQLGLTQDDQYVLKCAATVNDKPIETNFIDDVTNPNRLIKNLNFHQSSPQYRPAGCSINNCEALGQLRPQNSDVQTNIANPYYLGDKIQNNRATSQSTQVNFSFPHQSSIKKFRNQIAQCNCNLATAANPSDTEAGDKVLKECKSPLVIISVYPRQKKGTDENDTVKIIQRQMSPERKELTNDLQSNNITREKCRQLSPDRVNAKRMEAKLSRSRSPSPTAKMGSNKNFLNKMETTGKTNYSFKNVGPNINKSNKSYIINNLQEHKSCHCHNKKHLQTENLNRQQDKFKQKKSKDTEEVKKALVNSFLRNVNVRDRDSRHVKRFQPTDDASKVTINIDGENDRYDVLLEHSNYDTGVSVKKIKKTRQLQSFSSEEELNTKSLENLLLVSHERIKKNEYYQEPVRTQLPDVLKIKSTGSRVNIKDSIEICRRQGEHFLNHPKPSLNNDKNNIADGIFNTDSFGYNRGKYEDSRLKSFGLNGVECRLKEYFSHITPVRSSKRGQLGAKRKLTSILFQRAPGHSIRYSRLDAVKIFAAGSQAISISAPVKHYRGDNCSLSDPNERDKEIRELLGIMRCHRLQDTEDRDSRLTKQDGCCCHRKCSAGLMTGLSISKFFTSKCLKRKKKKVDMQHVTTQVTSDLNEESTDKVDPSRDNRKSHISKTSKKTKISEKSAHKHDSEFPDHMRASEEETSETSETTTEDSSKEHIEHDKDHFFTHDKTISNKEKRISKASTKKRHSEKKNHVHTVNMNDNIMSQNLILNRNIQIFLQVDKFCREKPVVLTRKQYDKVKRIIECTISKKLSIQKRKRCSLNNCNVVSIGEIKVKPKIQTPLRVDREIQTDRSELIKASDLITVNKAKNAKAHNAKHIINRKLDKHVATDVMVTERHNIEQIYPRQAMSSMEVRYASVEYEKRVIISSSSTHFKNDINYSLHTSNAEGNSKTIHTIFKGHKRSATPNLGTSAYSLYSNATDFSNKSYKQPQCAGDFKPKKPFLQRLISCLVMRSTQTSNIRDVAQKRKLPSVNSSVDSYHISTSLGAIEMTSSLYDTSASFYSNHTTMPVNKIKRGFFSSVRGFLTSRRS